MKSVEDLDGEKKILNIIIVIGITVTETVKKML